MAEAPRILLEHHLKRLKLPTFLREYEKLARQCAAEGRSAWNIDPLSGVIGVQN